MRKSCAYVMAGSLMAVKLNEKRVCAGTPRSL